jgi:hypothetical protein
MLAGRGIAAQEMAMSYELYKLIHFAGIFLTFLSLGGLTLRALSGGGDAPLARKVALASHGSGLLLVLVGGFGMLARLGAQGGFGTWVWIKLSVWVVLGAAVVVPKKLPRAAIWLWAVLPLLGLLAAWAAAAKI